jgi:hypothetical protein
MQEIKCFFLLNFVGKLEKNNSLTSAKGLVERTNSSNSYFVRT